MQFIDLKTQQKRVRQDIEDRIKKVLDHGQYILGPEGRELEENLSNFVGTKYGVGVASGTDALIMALMAYDVGPGDAIITTPFTFVATAEVIKLVGATPVFVDIEPDTFNIDTKKLEDTIKTVIEEKKLNLKGIIPVDLFGQAADYDIINKLANDNDLFVLQDACQSFGGEYKNKKTCSNAEIAATSFFPAKPLGCYGDGGMIFTNSDNVYEKLLSIRVHGQGIDKYENVRVGINGRMDTIQSTILLSKMSIFEDEIEKRQEVAKRYTEKLEGIVSVPHIKVDNLSAWAQYSVIHKEREKIIKHLQEQKLPVAVYYPIPLHLQKAFADLDYKSGDFPVSEKTAAEIFSLPMHPYLSETDQDIIVEAITKAVK